MLFTADAAAGIADGTITETYRRWRRPQAVVGHRYRTVGGIIVVDAVDVVAEDEVPSGIVLRGDPSLPVTRVRFHLDDRPDEREVLAGDTDVDVAALTARLDRLDAAADGPWTRATLAAIAADPGRRAGDLASALGRERDDLKRDVRKLKALGLTRSLPVGYELSPRGAAYLAAVRAPGAGS